LLNLERLGSYRRLGILEELLTDYLPEISRLVARLEQSAAARDLESTLEALHSLLGMSGEAGAQALYRQVRQIYVPMLEARTWPRQAGWADEIAALAAQTERALRDYGATTPALAAG
jgi:HPt (histidine-containing phosphotransfer) domain-containing protein